MRACVFCAEKMEKTIQKPKSNGKKKGKKRNSNNPQWRLYQCCFEQEEERSCGNFFHFACLKKDSRTIWQKEEEKQFICPQHVCCNCKEAEGLNVICTHCPNGYHVECMDLVGWNETKEWMN